MFQQDTLMESVLSVGQSDVVTIEEERFLELIENMSEEQWNELEETTQETIIKYLEDNDYIESGEEDASFSGTERELVNEDERANGKSVLAEDDLKDLASIISGLNDEELEYLHKRLA